ncbi:MAG: diguanylate cyclase [Parvibaculum sp.]
MARFAGPGLWIADDAEILSATDKSDALLDLLCPHGMWSELGRELIDAAKERHIATRRCIAPSAGKPYGSCAYDLTIMSAPCEPAGADQIGTFLILARDASFERNLIEALVHSRALYRDLVECAGDFVWEVDAHDRFSFVSPGGAVGYHPDSLSGAAPSDLALDPHEARELADFFAAREEMTEKEVWVRSANGEPACLIASVRPILDEYGRAAGARGVARDVTAERRRTRELNEQREDDALISALARAVQRELKPDNMLAAAANVLLTSLDAAAVWIGPLERASDPSSGSAEGPSFKPACARGPEVGDDFRQPDLTALAREALAEAIVVDNTGTPHIFRKGAFLCLVTCHGDGPNGMIILLDVGRRAEEMLTHAANHIGNAIEQAHQLQELDRLSRTDELTGLLNRRAFVEKVARALADLREGQQAALFLIDLDHFKAVNDTYGHAEGDNLLRILASLLQSVGSNVPGALNLPARLGGDEFALWLGGETTALTKLAAENLLRRFELVAGEYDDSVHPGLSIGIVMASAGDSLTDLLARADTSLYEVKRSGKGTWRMSVDQTDVASAELEG